MQNNMANRALIFVRRSGAYGIGHVGWGFVDDNGAFNVGAVENHSGGLHTSPSEMGFWTLRTRDPIAPMRDRHYDEFKLIDLVQADPLGAKQVVAWVKQQAYAALGRNCMDDAYDVLRAYGAQQLPVPAHHWEPNHWFNQVQGVHYHIVGDGVAPEDDTLKPAEIGAVEPDLASLNDASFAEETPVAPRWRTPESAEFHSFQAEMKAALPMRQADSRPQQSARSGLIIRLLRLLRFENHPTK